MPTTGKHCKHYKCSLGETDKEEDTLIIDCEKGHKAGGSCIVKGRPDCPDYEEGILYSLEEVKKQFGLE